MLGQELDCTVVGGADLGQKEGYILNDGQEPGREDFLPHKTLKCS
jgi:hypothetical protein